MRLKSLLAASLLLAALAAGANAQRKPVEFRQGDAFRGPVQSARIEHADFGRVDGVPVEGPRRLASVSTYTPDGRHKEQEAYGPDGSARGRFVHVYDDAGNEIEVSAFDRDGGLKLRRVYRPATGEVLLFNGDGSLRERRVVNKSPEGLLIELKVYDGAGALVERTETKTEGGAAIVKVYGPDGVLKRSAERGPGSENVRQMVEQSYNPDGTVFGRRVSAVSRADYAMSERVTDNDGYHPGPRRTRERREYDSRKNLSKIVTSVWNEQTGEFEPSSVSYYTVTYYH